MEFQFTPYLLPIIIAAVIPGGLAFYAWRHRRTRGKSQGISQLRTAAVQLRPAES